MQLSTSFVLLLLGVSSQFSCGFSLKSHTSLKEIHHPSLLKRPVQSVPSLASPNPLIARGGSVSSTSRASAVSRGGAGADGGKESSPRSIVSTFASLWAAGGVVMILGKSIKRILPIALEPFNGAASPLSQFQLASYIGMCLWFAYVEGYKGFQLKFSPLVVKRSQSLKPSSPIHHTIFGPFYAMGLFHATKKRKIVSWSVTTGVAVIVAAVKRLPYPWRNIVDAGVIVGLSWGSLSIAIQWFKAVVLGVNLDVDPALPEGKSD